MADTATAELPSAPTSAPEQTVVGGVVPYLNVSDASGAAEFYRRAFGAEEVARTPAPDGKRLVHCHLRINGGTLMLSDAFPEHGYPVQTPQAFTLHLQVADVQALWDRATAAGAEVITPLDVMFWGDRYGQLRDPFGVAWSMGGPA